MEPNIAKPILTIEGLKKYYGKRAGQTKALDGISFQVMPREGHRPRTEPLPYRRIRVEQRL